MRMRPILLRLCWRELSRGWVLLVFGLLLPPLAASVQNDRISLLPETPLLHTLILLAAVTIRAGMLAVDAREGTSYQAVHFPLHPSLASLTTFLSQLGIAVLIGVSAGGWSRPYIGVYDTSSADTLGDAAFRLRIQHQLSAHPGVQPLERHRGRLSLGDRAVFVSGNDLQGSLQYRRPKSTLIRISRPSCGRAW